MLTRKKILITLLAVITPLAALFASGTSEAKKPLTWIWYPNESAPEYAEARAEVIGVVSKAIGREIKDQTTTDYAIAIEALANNNAAFSWFGGEGYIQAHAKNAKVLPLVTNSSSATLETAKYYSMIGTLKENGSQYMSGGKYSLDTLKQKKFSFVSNSSTSGFRVPSSVMAKQFKVQAADLLEGGPDKVFAQVMFGGSHQGSFFNVLSGKADVGAFCNECIRIYVDWSQAHYEDPLPGDVIKVLPNADSPFDQVPGKEVVIITAVPVLNAPIVMNTGMLSQKEIEAARAALLADTTTANEKIFPPKGSAFKSFFTAGHRFLPVEDKWYDPIRVLAGMQ